jgi:copper chaperone CopZ
MRYVAIIIVFSNFSMMFRSLLILLLCFVAGSARAQFRAVYIGVNGLTCSQCSRTVEMSIRKLDFVADVQMNLEHTEGKIILKEDKKTDMEKIAQAVVDAGFSVRYLHADLAVDVSVIPSGSCFIYKGDGYTFPQPPKNPLKGVVKLKFVGKKYMGKNELKKAPAFSADKCKGATGKVYQVSL